MGFSVNSEHLSDQASDFNANPEINWILNVSFFCISVKQNVPHLPWQRIRILQQQWLNCAINQKYKFSVATTNKYWRFPSKWKLYISFWISAVPLVASYINMCTFFNNSLPSIILKFSVTVLIQDYSAMYGLPLISKSCIFFLFLPLVSVRSFFFSF